MLRNAALPLPLLLLVLPMVSGCQGGATPTVPVVAMEVPEGATALDPQQVERIPNAGYLADAGRRLIGTAEEWQAFWQEIHAHIAPVPPPPALELGGHLVRAVAIGTRPSGGHGVAVESVHRRGDDYFVTVEIRSPGPGCMSTMALTAPVEIVRLPRPTGAIHIVERQVTTDCD